MYFLASITTPLAEAAVTYWQSPVANQTRSLSTATDVSCTHTYDNYNMFHSISEVKTSNRGITELSELIWVEKFPRRGSREMFGCGNSWVSERLYYLHCWYHNMALWHETINLLLEKNTVMTPVNMTWSFRSFSWIKRSVFSRALSLRIHCLDV